MNDLEVLYHHGKPVQLILEESPITKKLEWLILPQPLNRKGIQRALYIHEYLKQQQPTLREKFIRTLSSVFKSTQPQHSSSESESESEQTEKQILTEDLTPVENSSKDSFVDNDTEIDDTYGQTEFQSDEEFVQCAQGDKYDYVKLQKGIPSPVQSFNGVSRKKFAFREALCDKCKKTGHQSSQCKEEQ